MRRERGGGEGLPMHIEYQCSNENVWEESGGTLQTITGLTSHETRVGGVQQVTGHMSALMRQSEEGEGRRRGFNCAYRILM